MNSGFTAYFKGSREVPGIADPKLKNSYMNKSFVTLKVMITYATEAVRQLDVDHRRCRFWDESNLEVSPLYTVNLCYGQCRAKLAIELCGCAPFFYVGVQQARYNICDVQGMLCLAEHVDDGRCTYY
ncbi:pickpocket protein 11-like [Cryptotermes secundus]|uniref:pickpocket protein 11-like n=1 Tax=Cryptotermes secundus TaxID=105785 RepID=UPI001454E295|nr:pickpocket protein 11-like [Cryptotermes secundus]